MYTTVFPLHFCSLHNAKEVDENLTKTRSVTEHKFSVLWSNVRDLYSRGTLFVNIYHLIQSNALQSMPSPCLSLTRNLTNIFLSIA